MPRLSLTHHDSHTHAIHTKECNHFLNYPHVNLITLPLFIHIVDMSFYVRTKRNLIIKQ